MTDISNATVFVTGAARGLGLALAREAVRRGARKVYAGVRDSAKFDEHGITPVRIDVNDSASVAQAAAQCQDTTILINNAGIAKLNKSALDADFEQLSREMMETNYYGVARTTQAFAPALGRNGQGAVVNVLSDQTWFALPMLAAYAASKSAAWNLTNALRVTLEQQGTRVVALHVGLMDTDMTRGLDLPKLAPDAIARATFDGLLAGQAEILADEGTQAIKRSLSTATPFYLDPPAF
jgi:NAD(P)-dependent dehydrogenase (short-subunit alcohol dehydrogenase family)